MQFRRRINIAPGVQLNLSKGGISVTVGPRGLRYTFGRGKSDLHLGIPGSGLYYRKEIDLPEVSGLLGGGDEAEAEAPAENKKPARKPRKARHEAAQEPQNPAAAREVVPPVPDRASPIEPAFREGAVAYLQGDYAAAFDFFSRIEQREEHYLADVLLMTGLSASYLEEYDTAIASLLALIEAGRDPLPGEPGSLVAYYLPDATIKVPITQFADVEMPLNTGMAAMLLAELLSARGRHDEAIDLIASLFEANVGDQALVLSLADLYAQEGHLDALHDLLVAQQDRENPDDDISLGLMYYWGIALAARELYEAAEEVFKTAQRKAKQNDELTKLLMYAHADLHERTGKIADARKLFERLYGLEPNFYDVAQRIEALKQT